MKVPVGVRVDVYQVPVGVNEKVGVMVGLSVDVPVQVGVEVYQVPVGVLDGVQLFVGV